MDIVSLIYSDTLKSCCEIILILYFSTIFLNVSGVILDLPAKLLDGLSEP